MDTTEYVSPRGAIQVVDSPVVATRLRARGWIPRPALETAASRDSSAKERLKLATDWRQQREARRKARSEAPGPPPADDSSPAAANADRPDDAESPVEDTSQAARTRKTTRR